MGRRPSSAARRLGGAPETAEPLTLTGFISGPVRADDLWRTRTGGASCQRPKRATVRATPAFRLTAKTRIRSGGTQEHAAVPGQTLLVLAIPNHAATAGRQLGLGVRAMGCSAAPSIPASASSRSATTGSGRSASAASASSRSAAACSGRSASAASAGASPHARVSRRRRQS